MTMAKRGDKHIDLLVRLVDSTLESIDNRRLERDLEAAKRWLESRRGQP
jgi:hypothetical protein